MSGATPASYATDGTDFNGALRYHYAVVLKRFAKFGLPCAAIFLQMYWWPMDYRGYFLPVAVAGFFGFIFTAILFYARMSLIRRCSRVLRTYPLEFRTPVESGKPASRKLHLRFGQRADRPVTLLAKDPLQRAGWPQRVTDGIWFAGDDPFGGAAIVPGTGELLFMQPGEWKLLEKERESAGEDRIQRAERAGIERAVSY